MLAWLLSADGDIDEIDVDVHGVLCLPDDKLIRVVDLIRAFTDDRRCSENRPSRVCDDDVN
jgi:hypothetical protein